MGLLAKSLIVISSQAGSASVLLDLLLRLEPTVVGARELRGADGDERGGRSSGGGFDVAFVAPVVFTPRWWRKGRCQISRRSVAAPAWSQLASVFGLHLQI